MANKNCVNDAELYLVKNSAHMGYIVDIDQDQDFDQENQDQENQDCDFESHVSEEIEENHQIRDVHVSQSHNCIC